MPNRQDVEAPCQAGLTESNIIFKLYSRPHLDKVAPLSTSDLQHPQLKMLSLREATDTQRHVGQVGATISSPLHFIAHSYLSSHAFDGIVSEVNEMKDHELIRS